MKTSTFLTTLLAGTIAMPLIAQPSTVVILYTGHCDVNSTGEPATFVAVDENDGIASPQVMQQRITYLSQMGVPTEFHLYPNFGHGFALGTGTSAEGWERAAVVFWKERIQTQ
ncbi:hypothetical protein BKK56_09455 [Rodentibacter genomosp. 2]|uniref:hypothetical protein n=1 Tax=Rodentibacter genomosp. 2 TaxID=1908266 RepID=UPI000984BCAC|nr:hypothetical protein BKK56_09455 [Rodentibacter genomosp. 2]